MKTRHLGKMLQAFVASLFMLIHSPTGLLAEEQSVKTPLGQLILEGKGVRAVRLERRRAGGRFDPNDRKTIVLPAGKIELPPGEYRVEEAQLEGGIRFSPPYFIVPSGSTERQEYGWFTLTPEKPHVLRVGGPLKPSVTVIREGRVLRMAYEVTDEDGRNFYYYDNPDNPPRFTVFGDGQVIGSGVLGGYS